MIDGTLGCDKPGHPNFYAHRCADYDDGLIALIADGQYSLVPVTDGQSGAAEPAEQGPGPTDPIVAD